MMPRNHRHRVRTEGKAIRSPGCCQGSINEFNCWCFPGSFRDQGRRCAALQRSGRSSDSATAIGRVGILRRLQKTTVSEMNQTMRRRAARHGSFDRSRSICLGFEWQVAQRAHRRRRHIVRLPGTAYRERRRKPNNKKGGGGGKASTRLCRWRWGSGGSSVTSP